MKNLARYVGIFTIVFYSAISHAELIYSPDMVLDTATGNMWRAYSTLEDGLSNGFTPATVAQTATLFLNYAPPSSGNTLPGYNPEIGGITSIISSSDGTSFSASWDASYLFPGAYPPSLIDAFGFNVSFGGWAPGINKVESLVGLVQDNDTWTSVWLRSTSAGNQSGRSWGNEFGIINPSAELFQNKQLFSTSCFSFEGECSNPFVDASGAVNIGGYLMVSSVPELPPLISLFVGLLFLSIFMRKSATNAQANKSRSVYFKSKNKI